MILQEGPWDDYATENSSAAAPVRPAGPRPQLQVGAPLTPPRAPPPQTETQQALDQVRLDEARADLTKKQTLGGLTPGQTAVDRKYADDFLAWRTGGYADSGKNISQLGEVISRVGKRGPNGEFVPNQEVSGWATGNTPDFINQVINPGAVDTREQIEEIIQRNLRIVLGAQFTQKEGDKLIARAFNPRLSEAENFRRLERLMRMMQLAATSKEDAARYYEEHGTLKGWRGKLFTMADFDLDTNVTTGDDDSVLGGATLGGPGRKLADDEEVRFGDDPEPTPGRFRLKPEQEAEVLAAAKSGDVGQTMALLERFTGNPPDRAGIEAAIAQFRKNPQAGIRLGYEGVDQSAVDVEEREKYGTYLKPALEGRKDQVLDPTLRGGLDTATFGFGDELLAGVNTVTSGGDYEDNLKRQRALDEADRRVNPGWRLSGQVAGALLMPFKSGVAGAGRGAATTTLRAGGSRAEAIMAARAASTGRLARESAGMGAAYGVGSSDGDIMDRLKSGAVGGGLGAIGGYAAGRGLSGVVGRFGTRAGERGEQIATAKAAQELDIPVPRSVMGGPMARRVASAIEQTPFGASPINRGTRDMLDAAEAAKGRIAGEVGEPLSTVDLGDAAKKAGEDMLTRRGTQATALYDAARASSGDTRVPLPTAITKADEMIAELSDTPGVAPEMLAPLRNIRSRLEGEWTPESVRRMRTQIADQFVEGGMSPSDASRRAGIITRAAEEDMMTGLRDAGNFRAARDWKAASDNWRANEEFKDSVLKPILGDENTKSGEDVAKAIMAHSRSNGTRLKDFLEQSPIRERNDIRATLIDELGRPGAGAQNASGGGFSLDTFLTNWNQIKGARDGIFPRETNRALAKLATVAERAKAAGRYRNTSNTGSAIGIGATAATVFVHPFATVAASIAQYGGGRLLASPGFAKRLANMPETVEGASRFWSGQWINKLARASPEIASELTGVRNSVLQSLSGASGKLAAEQPEKRRVKLTAGGEPATFEGLYQ